MLKTSKHRDLLEQPIRVLIADDHPRSRNGLRALLATSPQVRVIGEAVDGQEAIRLAETCQPDVILMDVQMPGIDGLEATQYVKSHWPDIRVILLTMYEARRADALTAGGDDFLVKGCPVETLLSAIFKVPRSTLSGPD